MTSKNIFFCPLIWTLCRSAETRLECDYRDDETSAGTEMFGAGLLSRRRDLAWYAVGRLGRVGWAVGLTASADGVHTAAVGVVVRW